MITHIRKGNAIEEATADLPLSVSIARISPIVAVAGSFSEQMLCGITVTLRFCNLYFLSSIPFSIEQPTEASSA